MSDKRAETCPPHALPPRPRAVSMFMAVPVIFGAFLLLAGSSVFLLGRLGGRDTGARVVMRYDVDCGGDPSDPVLAEADLALARIVDGRVREIGLGEPQISQDKGSLVVTATLPGLGDDEQAVPALLAREGTLEIRHGEEVLARRTDLVEARMRLDGAGMPSTDLVLAASTAERLAQVVAADPQGELEILIDGVVVGRRPNRLGIEAATLALPAGEGPTRDKMREVADRGIVLNHGPLPCRLTLQSVEPVSGSPTP